MASGQKIAARWYAERQQIITKGNKIVGPSVFNLMVNLQHYVNKVSKYKLALALEAKHWSDLQVGGSVIDI